VEHLSELFSNGMFALLANIDNVVNTLAYNNTAMITFYGTALDFFITNTS
jgi:hypothetical protein